MQFYSSLFYGGDKMSVSGVIFLIAIACIFVGGFLIFADILVVVRSCNEQTTAKVIKNVEEVSAEDGTVYYHPVFEFIANGAIKEVKSDKGRKNESAKVGEMVALFFNPNNPSEIYVPAWDINYKSYLVVGIGIVIFSIGYAIKTSYGI